MIDFIVIALLISAPFVMCFAIFCIAWKMGPGNSSLFAGGFDCLRCNVEKTQRSFEKKPIEWKQGYRVSSEPVRPLGERYAESQKRVDELERENTRLKIELEKRDPYR